MADSAVASLTANSGVAATDLFYADDGTNDTKATGAQIKTFCSASPTLVTPVIGAATGTSLAVTGAVTAFSGTAVPAGGAADKAFLISSTAHLGIYFGSDVPSVSAAKGSLYIRTDGSTTNDRMYINTDGGTTWTAVTTAA